MVTKQRFDFTVRNLIADRIRNRDIACSKHHRCWRGRLKRLEAGCLLAGDVLAPVQDSTLLVTGDELDNGVAILTGAVSNQFEITDVHADGLYISPVIGPRVIRHATQGTKKEKFEC